MGEIPVFLAILIVLALTYAIGKEWDKRQQRKAAARRRQERLSRRARPR